MRTFLTCLLPCLAAAAPLPEFEISDADLIKTVEHMELISNAQKAELDKAQAAVTQQKTEIAALQSDINAVVVERDQQAIRADTAEAAAAVAKKAEIRAASERDATLHRYHKLKLYCCAIIAALAASLASHVAFLVPPPYKFAVPFVAAALAGGAAWFLL